MKRFDRQLPFSNWLALVWVVAACGGGDGGKTGDHPLPVGAESGRGGAPPVAGSAGQMVTAGTGGTRSNSSTGGGSGGSGPSAPASGSGGSAPAGAAGGPAVVGELPASCAEAATPYRMSLSTLDPSLVPASGGDRFWAGRSAQAPVAVDAETNQVYVGFTRSEGGSSSAVIAVEGGAPDAIFTVPNAVLGAIAVTKNGPAALLFDPNPMVDARVWASVARFGSDRSVAWNTDLFRSPNLEDEGTKGAPSSGRLGYLADSDQLVTYFGHTQRYDDGVRHQGGYLATLDASGTQTLISGWWGSHNLDQRLLIDGARAAALGLGDAYPEGIFFSFVEGRPRTNVIYQLASAGNGATNGQLGGMVALGDQIIVPFITNRSIAQDLDAGTWPDIDEAISMQIREAAANGTDLGLLSVPKSAVPMGGLPAVWLDAQVTAGARLGSLKSAKYGTGDLILLAWAETTGTQRMPVSSYFTMVVDKSGAVCQPKTPLDAMYGFGAGDDFVTRPDGAIVWGNTRGNRINIVSLVPGG